MCWLDRASASSCCWLLVWHMYRLFHNCWGLWLIVRCIMLWYDILCCHDNCTCSFSSCIYCRKSWRKNIKIALLKVLKIAGFCGALFQNGW